jgi:hypothetical protein
VFGKGEAEIAMLSKHRLFR